MFKKGHKTSEETKLKISSGLLKRKKRLGYVNSPETRKKMSEAQKGHKHSKETLGKMSKSHKGKKLSAKTKEKMSIWQREEKSPHWKGQAVKYAGLHNWIRKKLGTPTKCEHCGKDNLTGRKIHWANKDHKYRRVKEDWIRLCRKCHQKYDHRPEEYFYK